MKWIIGVSIAVTAWCSQSVNAQASLIANGCGIVSEKKKAEVSPLIFVGTGAAGMSCDTIKQLVGAADVVHMAIMPALVVLRTPGVREELAAQLAVMGMTLANPAVLGVTVLGAFGYVTVYLVLKTTAEKCANQRMQDIIKQEVERTLNLRYSKPIEVTR